MDEEMFFSLGVLEDAGARLYALVGGSVGQSLSPAIHNSLFALSRRRAIYTAFSVDPAAFKRAFQGLLEIAGGLNITIPYKEEAARLLHSLDKISSRLGCVNTVHKMVGYNTDYTAVLELVRERQGSLGGMRCLVAGAGGAARALAFALGDLGCRVYVLNRTRERAAALVERLSREGLEAGLAEPGRGGYDVVANATPDPRFVPREDISGVLAIEMVYRPLETSFLKIAGERGMGRISGLEILVRQAIHAHRIWFGEDLRWAEEVVVRRLHARQLVW